MSNLQLIKKIFALNELLKHDNRVRTHGGNSTHVTNPAIFSTFDMITVWYLAMLLHGSIVSLELVYLFSWEALRYV